MHLPSRGIREHFFSTLLGIFRELGDRHGEGTTLTNLGIVYRQQGRWGEAMEVYEESLGIKRELGDRWGEGATLANMGALYQQLGQKQRAVDLWREALAIFQALGAPEADSVRGWLREANG